MSIKPNGKPPTTFAIEQPGNDQRVVREARDYLAEAAMWVTFYGKGFDVKMLEGKLLKWGRDPLIKKPHLDIYFHLLHKVNTSRKSLAHVTEWLNIPEKKMHVNPNEWNSVLYDTKKVMKNVMIPRCESDVCSLEGVFERTKHLVINVTR